jgi:lactate 2-monooxygenase
MAGQVAGGPRTERLRSDGPGPLFADHQYEIYRAGLRGERPDLPLSVRGLQHKAQEVLTPEAFGYVAGGAGSEDTMRANRMSFR